MKALFYLLSWPWGWAHEPYWWIKPHGWDLDRQTVEEL